MTKLAVSYFYSCFSCYLRVVSFGLACATKTLRECACVSSSGTPMEGCGRAEGPPQGGRQSGGQLLGAALHSEAIPSCPRISANLCSVVEVTPWGGEAVVSSPAYARLPLAPGTVTLQQLRSPRKPQRPSRIFPCCFRREQQSLSEERHPRAISLQETFS